MQINPFKTRRILAAGDHETDAAQEKIESAMSWRDAAKTAAVVALTDFGIFYFPKVTYELVAGDPARTAFEAVSYFAARFIAYFGALTGVTKLVTKFAKPE